MTTDDGLPFHEWMRLALYHEQHGYYSRRIQGIGRRGDFATSATVSDALGTAVAHWIQAELARDKTIRTVIEVGGGDGSLSQAVRRALGWWGRRRLRWCLVETSAVLKSQQQEHLGTRAALWAPDVATALRDCDGRALLFHNELVDAFPVNRYQWDDARATWSEIWLRKHVGKWVEFYQPIGSAVTSSALASWPGHGSPVDGQRIEVHHSYQDWLTGWASHWRAGAMLTVDYGDIFPQLYHRQPAGTLRGYLLHQRVTGTQIYESMGRQDLTADVNFTDLVNWGHTIGWQAEPLQTQAAFLQQHLPDWAARSASDAAVRFLGDLEGAGSAFKVLVQRPASAGHA